MKQKWYLLAFLLLLSISVAASCSNEGNGDSSGGNGGGGGPTLTSIAVTPNNPSIATGNTQQFTATGTYSDSSTQDLTASVTWNSSVTGIATISSGGLSTSTGSAAGSTTITATSGGVSGTTTLKVIINLPKTGQTTCYDAAGNVIDCAGTRQDGELQKGVAWPSPRFMDNGNGTVTDNLTGLIWLKEANCFSSQTWANAINSANTLNSGECGLTDSSVEGDWRLPNRKELRSLITKAVISKAT